MAAVLRAHRLLAEAPHLAALLVPAVVRALAVEPHRAAVPELRAAAAGRGAGQALAAAAPPVPVVPAAGPAPGEELGLGPAAPAALVAAEPVGVPAGGLARVLAELVLAVRVLVEAAGAVPLEDQAPEDQALEAQAREAALARRCHL